jgi:hypothetical protein
MDTKAISGNFMNVVNAKRIYEMEGISLVELLKPCLI